MKKNVCEWYEAPEVEIIEVEVEKGFATSPGTGVTPGGNLEGPGDEE